MLTLAQLQRIVKNGSIDGESGYFEEGLTELAEAISEPLGLPVETLKTRLQDSELPIELIEYPERVYHWKVLSYSEDNGHPTFNELAKLHLEKSEQSIVYNGLRHIVSASAEILGLEDTKNLRFLLENSRI